MGNIRISRCALRPNLFSIATQTRECLCNVAFLLCTAISGPKVGFGKYHDLMMCARNRLHSDRVQLPRNKWMQSIQLSVHEPFFHGSDKNYFKKRSPIVKRIRADNCGLPGSCWLFNASRRSGRRRMHANRRHGGKRCLRESVVIRALCRLASEDLRQRRSRCIARMG